MVKLFWWNIFSGQLNKNMFLYQLNYLIAISLTLNDVNEVDPTYCNYRSYQLDNIFSFRMF